MKRRDFIQKTAFGSGVLVFPGLSGISLFSDSDFIFKNGDTVCFIGDSITHNGIWQAFVSNYFITRFPNNNVKFINCGISGDTVAGAIKRFDSDIVSNNPNVAVVMLGMNDIRRWLYNTADPSEENKRKRKEDYVNYRENMTELIKKLKKNKCRSIILIKPSPYDQTAIIEQENLFGVNDVLGDFGKIIDQLADKYHTRVVDFHGPMTQITLEQQKKSSSFSFAPNDRVHPSEVGHQLMAYLFLKDLEIPELVSSVTIDFLAKKTMVVINGKIPDINFGKNKFLFTLLEKALPYPIKKEVSDIFNLVPLEKELNQQLVKIISIPVGNWVLKIDGDEIGQYKSSELESGINLAFNEQTPQFRQAQNILEANLHYYDVEALYRDYVKINIMLQEQGISLEDMTAIQTYFKEFPYNEGNYATAYYVKLFSRYFEIKEKLQSNKTEMENLFRYINEENKPVPHTYEFLKI